MKRVAPVLLVLALMAVPSHAALLAHYSFDSDFTDGSGNGNDLTVGAGTPAISATAGEHQFGGGALDLNSTTSDQHYLNLGTVLSFGSGDTWLLGICFLGEALECAVEGIGDGEKGG